MKNVTAGDETLGSHLKNNINSLEIIINGVSTFQIILCVLVLCTQVNMMFAMLLWVCIHTGQAEKLAWPRWESKARPLGH